jgi:hypothetical protein
VDGETGGCSAWALPLVGSIPVASGLLAGDEEATDSPFDAFACLFAAKMLSGMGLGSTAGLPSA